MITEVSTVKELLEKAKLARKKAYCPYSDISVGAALITKSGKLYLGSNIENSAFSPSVCAERVAFFKAISEGERDFSAIAVVGGKADCDTTDMFAPCGVCRQVMAEFCDKDFRIVLERDGEASVHTLSELLPHSFGKDKLG